MHLTKYFIKLYKFIPIHRFIPTSGSTRPIAAFFSNLTKSSASTADYEHAQRVWKHFKCKSFGDYHDLYLITVSWFFINFQTL